MSHVSEIMKRAVVIMSRYRVGFMYPSDSEEEGQKRVVKAHKDRKFEELKDIIKQAKNSKNIKDMSKLLSSRLFLKFIIASRLWDGMQ